jgi:hypothetical protein
MPATQSIKCRIACRFHFIPFFKQHGRVAIVCSKLLIPCDLNDSEPIVRTLTGAIVTFRKSGRCAVHGRRDSHAVSPASDQSGRASVRATGAWAARVTATIFQ